MSRALSAVVRAVFTDDAGWLVTAGVGIGLLVVVLAVRYRRHVRRQ